MMRNISLNGMIKILFHPFEVAWIEMNSFYNHCTPSGLHLEAAAELTSQSRRGNIIINRKFVNADSRGHLDVISPIDGNNSFNSLFYNHCTPSGLLNLEAVAELTSQTRRVGIIIG